MIDHYATFKKEFTLNVGWDFSPRYLRAVYLHTAIVMQCWKLQMLARRAKMLFLENDKFAEE